MRPLKMACFALASLEGRWRAAPEGGHLLIAVILAGDASTLRIIRLFVYIEWHFVGFPVDGDGSVSPPLPAAYRHIL